MKKLLHTLTSAPVAAWLKLNSSRNSTSMTLPILITGLHRRNHHSPGNAGNDYSDHSLDIHTERPLSSWQSLAHNIDFFRGSCPNLCPNTQHIPPSLCLWSGMYTTTRDFRPLFLFVEYLIM